MAPKKKSERARKHAVFSVLGEVVEVEGIHRFIPFSIPHLNACLKRVSRGTKLFAEFSEFRTMRSMAQLRYHWVLMKYIATHSGHTDEEIHDYVMRLKFGEKTIKLGKKRKAKIRRSISETGNLSKLEATELIEFDLALCAELEIRVPTAEELGYLPG